MVSSVSHSFSWLLFFEFSSILSGILRVVVGYRSYTLWLVPLRWRALEACSSSSTAPLEPFFWYVMMSSFWNQCSLSWRNQLDWIVECCFSFCADLASGHHCTHIVRFLQLRCGEEGIQPTLCEIHSGNEESDCFSHFQLEVIWELKTLLVSDLKTDI